MGKKLDLEHDFFTILGVKASSSDEDVKKAYKALAKQWHPDKNSAEGAEETFKLIAAAYDTLKTADGRSIYRREKETAQADKERESRREQRDSTSFRSSRSDSGSRFNFNSKYNYDTGTGPSTRGQRYYTPSGSGSRFYSPGTGTDDNSYSGPYSNGHKGRSSENGKNGHKYKFKYGARKPWSNEWEEPDEDGYTPFGFSSFNKPSFSSAFNSFVDDLFDFSSFFNTSSGSSFFETFFSGPENFSDPFTEKGRHDPRSKYFDKFDDIGSAKKTNNNKSNSSSHANMNGKKADHDIPGFSFNDYSDGESTLFECSCCGKSFSLEEDMIRHETICKEVHGKANSPKRPVNGVFAKPTGDWRTTHDDLIKNIRNLRRSSQTAVDDDDDISPPQDAEYIKCQMCGRTFYKSSLDRHVPLCRIRNQQDPSAFPMGKPPPADPGPTFGAKEYPRTMPSGYPGSSTGGGIPRSSSRTSQQPDSDDPWQGNSAPGRYSSKTCFPNLGSRNFMDEPFTFTSSGLHAHRSSSQASPCSPRAMPNSRFPPPGARGFDVPGSGIGSDRYPLGGNLCPNCHSVYAKNARYCMKCGFKRAGQSPR